MSSTKNKFQFAVTFAACLMVLSSGVFAQNAEIAEAKRLMEIDQTQKALDVLNKGVTTYPTSGAAAYYLGTAQLKAGKRAEALQTFDKGIAADAKDALNYTGKAQLSMMENAPEKAKMDIDKALSMTKSKNVSVLQAAARAYMVDPKKANDAVALLTKAASIDKENAETQILLGDAYLQINDGGKAVSAYERAASLDNKSALAHYKTGRVYLRSRNYDAAQEAFAKAIQIDPSYTLAYKEQGELFYQMKQAPQAVEAYKKYLSLTEKPETGQSKMAFYHLMAKDFTSANTIFKELIAKDSLNPMIHRYYGISLYEAQDYPAAQTTFEQYLAKAKPEAIEAGDYRYYGLIQMKQNLDSLATEAFDKSLALDSLQPELLQLSAESYYKQKKFDESIDAYQKLFKAKKPASADYYTLGRAYYFAEKFPQADSTFAKLSELQPNLTVGPFWAARSKSAQDSTSENGLAKPYYEKLVEKALLTPEKSKTELIESYLYLGYYSYLKGQVNPAKDYYKKVLGLDPQNEKAQTAIKALNAPAPKANAPAPKAKTGGG
ncbi:MAG: tetratricopeptide repeat protein [Chryseolinea sp.]